MNNILYATTRNFNPGDEIIYRGVRNLLEGRWGQTNPVYWNRHPNIRPANANHDNSYDRNRVSPKCIDYVAFAGSPGWVGTAAEELYKEVLEGDDSLRMSFFGLGSTGHSLHIGDGGRRILNERTDVALCRDSASRDAIAKVLKGGGPDLEVVPCPSVFHCQKPRVRSELKVIGLNYQSDGARFHSVNADVRRLCLEAFRLLANDFEVRIICNFIDDFHEACLLFDRSVVRFSADSADFYGFFDEIDCMVGPRLHGCLGAIGTGAPALLLDSYADARRCGAAEMVPVLGRPDNSVESILECVRGIKIEENSKEVLRWIEATRNLYEPFLKKLAPRKIPVSNGNVCGYIQIDEAENILEKHRITKRGRLHSGVIKCCQYLPSVLHNRLDRQFLGR